jgi:hypothetical protein
VLGLSRRLGPDPDDVSIARTVAPPPLTWLVKSFMGSRNE